MGKKSRKEKKNTETTSKNPGIGTFSNEKIEKMFNSLTKEQQEEFKTMGDNIFNQFDLNEDGKMEINLSDFNKDYTEETAYIYQQIKAGIHISYLSKEEKNLMTNIFGEKWYEKWGYVKEDLEDIITTSPNLED